MRFLDPVQFWENYTLAPISPNMLRRLSRLGDFASCNSVLPCDTDTASFYGLIKKRLLEKGKPIPENDIWIAAVAYQHSLTVISRDDHFNEVEKLKFETW